MQTKVAIPLGRLNSISINMVIKYFDLDLSFFNSKKEREFIFKKDNYIFYFLKPKDLMKFCITFNVDYAIISNDYFYNFDKNNLFDIVTERLLEVQRLSLITKNVSLDKISTIITPYDYIAKKYYPDKEILNFNSSLEIYPNISSTNGIIDIVETGKTIKIHNLKETERIMDTKIFLIKNKQNLVVIK